MSTWNAGPVRKGDDERYQRPGRRHRHHERLIQSRLPEMLGQSTVEVTTESPIALTRLSESDPKHRLNLFLYEVRPCAAFRSQPPPTTRKGSSGQVPLALELYYILSPYPINDEHEQQGQQLLGMGLLALHDLAVIGRRRYTSGRPTRRRTSWGSCCGSRL